MAKKSTEQKITQTLPPPQKIFVTPRQLCERNPAISEGGLRFWLFNSEQNGLEKCVRRVGRKILIDENLFLIDWLDSQKKI